MGIGWLVISNRPEGVNMKWFYRCYTCGAKYEIAPGRYLCDICAKRQQNERPLEGVLEAEWEGDPDADAVPLPVEKKWFPPIPVGNTPLWSPVRLRHEFNAPNLWLKDDTCNPSGSLKDRASFLVAAFARKHEVKEIVLASTGNAASSMAAVGAAAGLRIKVFLPAKAPLAKRIQILQYGAELIPVDGTYDKAYELSLEYTNRTGSLSRNTAYNPLTIEGKKTVAFEILEDLIKAGSGAPGQVFVPVGDGVILAGDTGIRNLFKLGRIQKMPTIWACQAEGSSAIARAFASTHSGNNAFGDPYLPLQWQIQFPSTFPERLARLAKLKNTAAGRSSFRTPRSFPPRKRSLPRAFRRTVFERCLRRLDQGAGIHSGRGNVHFAYHRHRLEGHRIRGAGIGTLNSGDMR
jgi:threonine synthase